MSHQDVWLQHCYVKLCQRRAKISKATRYDYRCRALYEAPDWKFSKRVKVYPPRLPASILARAVSRLLTLAVLSHLSKIRSNVLILETSLRNLN